MSLPSELAAVRGAVRRTLPEADDRPVLVACSGGADSLALVSAAVFESRERPNPVVGVTVVVRLAAAAAPVFLAMSLLPEGHRWSERAILALDDATRGGAEETRLQAVLGVTLMFTRGNGEAARMALERSLAVAEDRGDAANQLRQLNLLHIFHQRSGDFKAALHYARRSLPVAETIATPAALGLADRWRTVVEPRAPAR